MVVGSIALGSLANTVGGVKGILITYPKVGCRNLFGRDSNWLK